MFVLNKKIFILVSCFTLTSFSFYAIAQTDTNRIIFGGHANPFFYLNNAVFTNKLSSINPDTIGTVFFEGDRFYVKNYYGNHKDTSFIRRYCGSKRDSGFVFIFTKDKVKDISIKQFKRMVKVKSNILLKINSSPLTDNPDIITPLLLKAISKIEVVEDFKLTKWDTGQENTYMLFIIRVNTEYPF